MSGSLKNARAHNDRKRETEWAIMSLMRRTNDVYTIEEMAEVTNLGRLWLADCVARMTRCGVLHKVSVHCSSPLYGLIEVRYATPPYALELGGPGSRTWAEWPYETDVFAQDFIARHPSGASLEEIADAMGVSRERVRQIEKEAIAKVRRKAGPKYRQMVAECLDAGDTTRRYHVRQGRIRQHS